MSCIQAELIKNIEKLPTDIVKLILKDVDDTRKYQIQKKKKDILNKELAYEVYFTCRNSFPRSLIDTNNLQTHSPDFYLGWAYKEKFINKIVDFINTYLKVEIDYEEFAIYYFLKHKKLLKIFKNAEIFDLPQSKIHKKLQNIANQINEDLMDEILYENMIEDRIEEFYGV